MLSLALIPGLPKTSFFLMAGLLVVLARRAATREPERLAEVVQPAKAAAQEKLEALLHLDELALEVGSALVPLVDEKQGGQLLGRIRALRRHLALQLGFIVPSVHITDNLQLNPREYVIRLRGVEVARWEMVQDCLLAISSEASAQPLEGKETLEPAFQVAAKWIAPSRRERALAAGYAVADQTSVLATHLAEIIKQHAHELLTRQETKRLLDSLSERQPKLVEELVPKLLSLGEVQKVLQQLLREQVSIRDLTTILETLQDTVAATKNPVLLVEAVRQALGRALVPSLRGGRQEADGNPGGCHCRGSGQPGLRAPRPRRSIRRARARAPSPGRGESAEFCRESTSLRALLSCSATARQGFICAGCLSPSCLGWWSYRRPRFRPP